MWLCLVKQAVFKIALAPIVYTLPEGYQDTVQLKNFKFHCSHWQSGGKNSVYGMFHNCAPTLLSMAESKLCCGSGN